jgi:hypothetical protein
MIALQRKCVFLLFSPKVIEFLSHSSSKESKRDYMKGNCIFILLLAFSMLSSLAQEAVIPAGGDETGSGGSVAYSVGQILNTSCIGTSAGIIHGVQQPYEISVITGLDVFKEIGLNLSTYPNPVSDILILKVESLLWKDLDFQMYNIEGKMIMLGKLLDEETNIHMSNLAPGAYFLRVNMQGDAVKTFKIVKK